MDVGDDPVGVGNLQSALLSTFEAILARPSSDMGSEHYCLRWNNHQSNLLGVFSQLLRDESLVDVTLACSEGHSIRAHRVVLSACSSYFQTLFVDHPSRHPIVILKDVRFSELRTLIEFMYKGEVNVEYCQLSALLKTAESLKVKGLAEMTNLSSAAAHEHERDVIKQEQRELVDLQQNEPQQQQPQQPQPQMQSQILHNRLHDIVRSGDIHRGSDHRERERDRAERERDRAERERDRAEREREHREREHAVKQSTSSLPIAASDPMDQLSHRLSEECVSSSPPHALTCVSPLPSRGVVRGPPPQSLSEPMSDEGGGGDGDISGSAGPLRSSESPESLRIGVGTSSSGSVLPGGGSGGGGGGCADGGGSVSCVDRPNDMSMNNNNNNSGGVLLTSSCATSASSSRQNIGPGSSGSVLAPGGSLSTSGARLSSPHESEPIAGPSGLPPVQQVPLSLKKEVDWGGGMTDDKSTGESSSDYRHPYDPLLPDDETAARSGPSSRSSTPAFPFLWGMFGSPLDDASSRLLSLLNSRLASSTTSNDAEPSLFRCYVCLASFPSAWLLKRHAALQHSILAASSPVPPLSPIPSGIGGEDKPFVCEQCGQSYRYRSAYLKHREQNHRARLPADKLFTCDVCGMQFRYLKSFKKHRLNHALERLHGRGRSEIVSTSFIPSTSQSVTETGTDEVSSTNESVGASTSLADKSTNEIMYSEIKQEPPDEQSSSTIAECVDEPDKVKKDSECDQDSTIDSLTFALTSVGNNNSGAVDPYQIAQEASILNLLHADAVERQRERRFACPFCGKCVRSKENLKLHVRKHTGERPFVCLFCGRAFGGKSDLTRHLRIHTGERPYHCEMCGKCFARADYLSKHLTTHMHSPR